MASQPITTFLNQAAKNRVRGSCAAPRGACRNRRYQVARNRLRLRTGLQGATTPVGPLPMAQEGLAGSRRRPLKKGYRYFPSRAADPARGTRVIPLLIPSAHYPTRVRQAKTSAAHG